MPKPLKILHLEGSLADADLMEHLLHMAECNFTSLRVESLDMFAAALEEFDPDIILAEYRLSGFDGMQALLIAQEKRPLTPFIFVTDVLGEDIVVETLKKGAVDYIIKDRMARLPIAILQAIEKRELLLKHEQNDRAVLHSEMKFRTIFESSVDAILFQDDKAFIDCNSAALKMYGCASRDELIGQPPSLFSARTQANGEDSVGLAKQYIAKAFNNETQYFEWVCRRLDGVEFSADVLLTAIEIDHRKLLLAMVHDISVHKAQQRRIQHLSNIYAALSQCNQAIAHCPSEIELFPRICQDAVHYGNMKMAWIGLIDETTQQIKPVASYGAGAEYFQDIETFKYDNSLFNYVHHIIDENKPFYCQDYLLDSATVLWHELAALNGWRSLASLPLRREGDMTGVLTFYADSPHAFDEETRQLLDEMSVNIDFALDNFAREAKRRMSEVTLKESEQRFKCLVEQSIAGAYIIQDEKFVYVNHRFEEILGYTIDNGLLGCNPLEIVAPKDRSIVVQQLDKLRNGEADSLSLIFTALQKDGTTIEIGMNSSKAIYLGSYAIIGLIQDITDKKVAQEQITRYATQLQTTFMQTVRMVTMLNELRDPYTAGHERRVAEIAVAIGKELNLSILQLEGLQVGGYLHDVGKISIPAEILCKPGKISAIEYELIKTHALAGYDVLKDVDFPWPVAQIALQHHERMDGSGYPYGLKDEEILFEARIIAVADVLEAIASHRPYHKGLGIEIALAEIERGRGTQFDLQIANACLRLFRIKGYILPLQ